MHDLRVAQQDSLVEHSGMYEVLNTYACLLKVHQCVASVYLLM